MKTYKWIIALVLTLTAGLGWAQDGKSLFEAKCNTCHDLKKNSTGPMLQGVHAKWEEAGELEYLYEWVKNPQALITSGKSAMANAIKDYSPTVMSPQQVGPEEVDAILAYVDAWEPPAEVADNGPTGEGGGEVIIVPNYTKNLNMFYALAIVTIFLLFAIVIMSGTVLRLVKSDYFKKKVSENNNTLKTLLLLVLFTGVAASPTFALTFNGPGEAGEGQPWLLIENMDLYVLLTIDIILLLVLLYVRRLFNTFLNMTKKEEEVLKAQEEGEVLRRVNQVLTDAVAIEDEHTILMDHEYDGIQELDNNLPPWWVWGFYFTIGFAIVYLFNYHIFKTADLQEVAYKKDVARAEAEVKAYLESKAMNVDENNVTLLTDPSAISAGKAVFSQNCTTCHDADGQGMEGSGPNLTDKNWIYGYDIKDVFTTVKYGRPGGMPEHGSKLTPVQLQQVASYVLQLPEKKGAAPKGDIIEE